MTAPTEQEIRDAIAERIRRAVETFPEAIRDANALDPIDDSDMALTRRGWVEGFYPSEDHPGTFWADLTTEEIEELHCATEGAMYGVLDGLADRITDAVVAATVAYAKAHPDIPRGTYGKPQLIPA
jgi:hypothetical protein